MTAALVGAPAASAQIAFPPTPVGADAGSREFVIVNEDPEPITLLQPAFAGPDAAAFRVVTDTCAEPLDSGEACTVTVTFRPARIGAHTATLQVPVEGDPDAPLESGLSGEGIPWLRIAPSILDFGSVFFRTTQHVLVENISGRDITALSPRIESFTGAFRRDLAPAPDRCGSTLAAGASCRVGITFMPRPGVTEEARVVFWGRGVEIGRVSLRGTWVPRPPAAPIRFPTPDATAELRERLRAALARLRGRSREALLKHGLVVRGIIPPAQGRLDLVVQGRRASPRRDATPAATLVAARRSVPVEPGRRVTIRARLTRAGKRLLRSARPLILEVKLTLVARSDDRLSEATRLLRLGRVAKRCRSSTQTSPSASWTRACSPSSSGSRRTSSPPWTTATSRS
jgi:hypothetical protein